MRCVLLCFVTTGVKHAEPSCGVRAVQLEQAEAFLRAAGVDPSALKEGLTKKRSKKDKRDKGKHKHKHKDKTKE